MTTIAVTRAQRNNNPGNIRQGDKWQGLQKLEDMTEGQRAEKDFCVFQSPKWGFRALATVLINYQDRHEIRTIAGVISRWAPAEENDTQAYIAHVCALTGLEKSDFLDLHTFKDLRPLCKAIAVHESGSWLFEDSDLDSGLTLAGVPPDVAALSGSRTIKTAIGSGVVAVPAIVNAVQQIKPAIDTISAIKEYLPLAAIVIMVVALAAIVYFRVDDWVHAKDRGRG